MTKITVISAIADDVQVFNAKSMYLKPGSVLFVQDPSFDVLNHVETIEQMKREHQRLQKRYDNLLKGLEYWKGRALDE